MKRLSVVLLFSLFIAGFATHSSAQQADKPKTIAILPWVMLKGTDGAQKTGKEFLETTLTRANFEVIPAARVNTMWTNGLGHPEREDRKEIPSSKELLALGEKLGVDYVVAGKADWHTKSVWIGLGPKTKSDCTVDLMIVDVAKKEIALDARGVKMDSTAKEDSLKAAGTVFLTPLFTAVSGGPKTPHEQRAVQLAIAKAITPWLPVAPQNKKIDK